LEGPAKFIRFLTTPEAIGAEFRLIETTKFDGLFLGCFEGFQGQEGLQGQSISAR